MRVGKMRMMVWLLVVCLKRLSSDWLPPRAGDAHFVTGAAGVAARADALEAYANQQTRVFEAAGRRTHCDRHNAD